MWARLLGTVVPFSAEYPSSPKSSPEDVVLKVAFSQRRESLKVLFSCDGPKRSFGISKVEKESFRNTWLARAVSLDATRPILCRRVIARV